MIILKLWVIFYLFSPIQGLLEWSRYSILFSLSVHVVHLKRYSQETDNDKLSAEFITKNNYFNRPSFIKNANGEEITKPTFRDTIYDYSHLVLTTAINVNEIFTVDSNITRKDNINKYVKKTIGDPKNTKKKFEVSYQDGDFTRSETNTRETSNEENQYRAHTPARRIFHGHKTKIKHFPFLVTVHVLGRFICGGSIIKSDLVITAASCLKRWQEWLQRTSTTQQFNETTTSETTIDDTTTYETTTYETTTDITSTETTTDITTTETTTSETTTDVTTIETDQTETTDYTTDKVKSVSSEDSGRSSSYETTAKETTIAKVTPPNLVKHALSVRIGTNYYRLGGKVVNVINVYFHPSYNEINLRNNLVIMRLERHLSFKRRRVRQINVTTVAADVPENTQVTIAGWGAKTYHNKVYNALWNLIHKSVLTVSPRDQCIETYTRKFVTSTNFCAQNERHEGACNRDAGNPAVMDGVLVGIVSFGSPKCGSWDDPTVFTNIGYYTEWIESIMGIELTSSSNEDKNREKPSPEMTTTDTTVTTEDKISEKLLRIHTPVYYEGDVSRKTEEFLLEESL